MLWTTGPWKPLYLKDKIIWAMPDKKGPYYIICYCSSAESKDRPLCVISVITITENLPLNQLSQQSETGYCTASDMVGLVNPSFY